ncbi:MAG: response regulator, partial [Planctomycetes bacterium]|nr:response regulator [Planctomycetota bacterium]
ADEFAGVRDGAPNDLVYDADRQGVRGVFRTVGGVADATGEGLRTGVFAQMVDLTAAHAEVLRDATRQSLIGGGLFAGISVLLWLALRRVLIQRIERVHDFAVAFEASGAAREIPVTGRDEIAGLARRLEVMAETISERSRLLRESQKMEAVGRLAGGVAHDFNNYLTTILGNAGLARSGAVRDPAAVEALMAEIEHAANSAAELTRQLLTFGRQRPTTSEPLDLSVVVGQMKGLLERAIGPDHRLRFELAPECFVLGDRVQLEQVVLNLVVNAADAMPAGGDIDVCCRRDGDAAAGSPAEVLLTVADEGAGIEERHREQIFEPFFTTKELGAGTGLGLATVFMIVDDAGGRIDVDSTVGVGTTFAVRFPATAERPTSVVGEVGADAASAPGVGRVVVCDDHPDVRRVMVRMLEGAGFEVESFTGGVELLTRLDELSFDVLVTDLMMPEMSGVDLARRVLADCPDVGILFVSGYAPDVERRTLDTFPDSAFLTKPVDARQLAEAVAQLIANKTRSGRC